jgi:Ca2+-binding RTX toxin-like protein
MGLFLLFSLAAGSAALLGVINLFDGNSATPEASAEEIALLEGDAITATEQMLADDPTRGEDIEALDLTPFTTEYDEYYVDFTATPGDDLIVLPEEGSADYPDYGTGSVIFGDEGDDTMIGQSAGDVFFGEAGDDELFGGGGNDQLFGGTGNDLLSGGPGNDLLTTETADGSDTLYGGAGDDEIAAFGEIGTDAIHHISGGAGDDNITLQGGAYLVSLGSGADMVTLQPEDGESGVSSAALISDFDVT